MEIKVDDLQGSEIQALLTEHLLSMKEQSPACSMHALDTDGLSQEDVTVWSLWEGAELAGCGALKHIDDQHGEIKSMRTVKKFLRRGVAAKILLHIIDEAKKIGCQRLSLETGSQPGFEPARQLYARFGFEYCGPFADYIEDPNSVYMTIVV